MNTSIALPQIELIDIQEFAHSSLISKCAIKVCYVQDTPNRNNTVITKEVAKQMAPSLRGAAIVGYYDEEAQDFAGHERELVFDEDGNPRLKELTRPYGFVDINADVWFQHFQDSDGVVREYLCTEGYIWTGAYPESQRILEKGNNQSMELSEKNLSGSWANCNKSGNRFFIINEAIIEKLCILGENVEPCFEGAQIKNTFSLEDQFAEFRNVMFSLISEIKKTLKGGVEDMNEEIKDVVITEEETILEEVEYAKKDDEKETEEEPGKEEKTSEEDEEKEETSEEEDKKKKPEYSLDEIPEYVELLNKYAALETERDNLQTAIAMSNTTLDTLNAEIATLREFKLAKEREEKQAMINSFYMLSAEDKQDVIENIDNYSLNDIEAKLAVICVRNKVNFSLDEEEKTEDTKLLFNLEQASDNAPAWVKAVRETASNM